METDHFKQLLEEELQTLNQELAELGHEDIDASATEADEVADRFEEQEEHEGESSALSKRRAEVKAALERITAGTYGICEECGEKIGDDRLEANPAAAVCSKHL